MAPIDLSRDIVMGHEFCAEVLELGPDTTGPRPGTRVVSVPVLLSSTGLHQLAYNNAYPGGYAQYMVLSRTARPRGPQRARPPGTLRSPSLWPSASTGWPARVPRPATAAVVVGCGPVGLAVIAALRAMGVESIVAADLSPSRRAMARTMGADRGRRPLEEGVVDAWRRVDGRRPLVAFEAVGVPGMLQQLLHDLPPGTRVAVVGVCMEPDRILPFFAIAKELSLHFALAYGADEFAGALRALAEGEIDVSPMITGTVDLDGVPGAFEALARPDEHVKILVEPAAT